MTLTSNVLKTALSQPALMMCRLRRLIQPLAELAHLSSILIV